MVMFSEQDIKNQENAIWSYMMGLSFPGADEEYKTIMQQDLASSNLAASTRTGITNEYAQRMTSFMNNESRAELDEPLFQEPTDETTITGSNMNEIQIQNTGFNQRARQDTMFDLTRMMSADFAIGQQIERWNNSDMTTIAPNIANAMAKEQGADIKFDRPVSSFEISQSVNTYLKKKRLEETMALLQSTGSNGFFNDALVMASGLAGGVGPLELGVSTIAGVAAPELGIASLAKAGSYVSKSLKAKKALNAARAAKTLKTTNEIAGGLASPAGSAARTAASPMISKRAAALEKNLAEAEKLSRLTYDNLSIPGKFAADSLSFTVADLPFIVNTRRNSEDLGWDLYSEKDMAMDTLFATSLGVFLPGAARTAADRLGFRNSALLQRRIDDARTDITKKEALGEITPEEATASRAALDQAQESLNSTAGKYKEMPDFFKEQVETLAKTNTSDETFHAQMEFVLQQLKNGNRPRVSMIPHYEDIMSHIDARVLANLRRSTSQEVFGENLIKESTPNRISKLTVRGETGLLGKRQIAAITEEDALRQMDNMYKGFILKDRKSLQAFRAYANNFNNMLRALEDMYEKVQQQLRANTAARGSSAAEGRLTADKLVNVKEQMKNAYFTYKFGPERMLQIKRQEKNQELIRAMGFEEEIPDEIRRADQEFNDWFSTYVEEKPSETKKGTVYLYNFINEKGKNDYGSTFSKYLSDLKKAAEDNLSLAHTDDIISTWQKESVEDIVRNAQKLDVSFNTDLNNLFGVRRRTYADMTALTDRVEYWDGYLAPARIEYNKILYSPEYNQALSDLRRLSSKDKSQPSIFQNTQRTIDCVRAFRDGRYDAIKEKIVTDLKNSEAFQNKIIESVSLKKPVVGVEFMIRDSLSAALAESGLASIIGSTNRIVNDVMAVIRRELREHPEKLQAFFTPENVESQLSPGIGEYGTADLRNRIMAKNISDMMDILNPIESAIDTRLAEIELQNINDVKIAVNKMQLMLENPHIAAEILTGGATQTWYTFAGSKRSVEYMSKTMGYYMADLKNHLREAGSKDGSSNLLEYYVNPNNKSAITEAIIRIQHGETEGFENSDAYRAAQIILDEGASFLEGFRKFGASYDRPTSVVKRSRLQFADTAISEGELDELYTQANRSVQIDADEFLAGLPRVNEAGEIKRGNRLVMVDKKVITATDAVIKTMQKEIRDLQNVQNPIYRHMAAWAFRSFDLDRMFDKNVTSKVSLNAVRDAVLSGDWSDVITDDLQSLYDASAALKRIVTRLIGRKRKKLIDDQIAVDPLSWTYSFRSGLADVGAVTSGEKSAALDSIENGIYFKNADEEIHASNIFGFDSMQESIESDFNAMFQAYYALENFGSRPVGLAEELVDTYNSARRGGDSALVDRIDEITREQQKFNVNVNVPKEKFAITEGKKQSVRENILLACGLQSHSPSAATRVVKIIQNFLSASLLVKAGLKSFSDFSTNWEAMLTNGFALGRGEAMALAGKAGAELMRNKDIMDMVLATTVLSQEDIFRKMANDPGADIVELSKNASMIDKAENWSRRYANFMMNSIGQLSTTTNYTKNSAAYAIQMAIGKQSGTAYKNLNDNLKRALLRESISGEDWDFMRKYLVHDLADYVNRLSGRKIKGESYKIFIPLSLSQVTDNTLRKELTRRGEKNITQRDVNEFRRELISKAWNMVDTSADEAVSIPSGRVLNILRGGRARNSGLGTLAELVTQFQAFGASILYNTYGRRLANFAADEIGVTILDLFNPMVKLKTNSRWKIFGNVFGMMMSIAMAMLIVDTAVASTAGQIQRPIGEDGKIHADNLTSAMLGALGSGGVVLDAALEGIDGSGQRGGGFAIQVAPSLSNVLRTGYRVTQPLRSSRVPEDQKGEAFASAIVQEAARFTGLKTAPFVSLIYQDWAGAWLDSKIKGGYGPYSRYIDGREDRGMIIMPWERNPEPIWERLQ